MHFNKHTRFRSNYIRSQPYVNLSNNSHEIISTLSIVYTVKIKYSSPLYSPAYVLALSLMFKMFRPLGMIFDTHTHIHTHTCAIFRREETIRTVHCTRTHAYNTNNLVSRLRDITQPTYAWYPASNQRHHCFGQIIRPLNVYTG